MLEEDIYCIGFKSSARGDEPRPHATSRTPDVVSVAPRQLKCVSRREEGLALRVVGAGRGGGPQSPLHQQVHQGAGVKGARKLGIG